MKIQWKKLIIAWVIPLAVGGLSSLFTAGNMDLFKTVEKPPLAPPSWLFPVAWTILYLLMGTASYLVATSKENTAGIPRALAVYGLQLFFNFLWPIFFFNLQWYLFSLIWLVALWVLIIVCIALFAKVDKRAAYLMIPYLLWVTFAGYLNAGIYILN